MHRFPQINYRFVFFILSFSSNSDVYFQSFNWIGVFFPAAWVSLFFLAQPWTFIYNPTLSHPVSLISLLSHAFICLSIKRCLLSDNCMPNVVLKQIKIPLFLDFHSSEEDRKHRHTPTQKCRGTKSPPSPLNYTTVMQSAKCCPNWRKFHRTKTWVHKK